MKPSLSTIFKIELLANGIIYVERRDTEQAERALGAAFERISELAGQLRKEGKPVLILNNARENGVSPTVLKTMEHLDFDKAAVYGPSKRANHVRDLMARANGLELKLASFETKKEALAWLQTS